MKESDEKASRNLVGKNIVRLSQVSGSEFGVATPLLNGLCGSIEMTAESGIAWWPGRYDLRQTWAQDGNIGSGIEERDAQPKRRYSVAMFPRQAFDEAVQTQTPQLVSHPALGDGAGIEAQ